MDIFIRQMLYVVLIECTLPTNNDVSLGTVIIIVYYLRLLPQIIYGLCSRRDIILQYSTNYVL